MSLTCSQYALVGLAATCASIHAMLSRRNCTSCGVNRVMAMPFTAHLRARVCECGPHLRSKEQRRQPHAGGCVRAGGEQEGGGGGGGVSRHGLTCVRARYALVDPELCQLCFQQPGRDSLRHVAHGGVGSHR